MDNQVAELVRLLDEEASLHRELLTVLQAELEILRRFAVSELEDNSRAKEKLVFRIRSVEESRRNLVTRLTIFRAGAEEPTLAAIADDSEEPYRSRLLEIRDDLIDATRQIINLNNRNRVLIASATHSMNHLMSLIAFAGQNPPLYNQAGRTGKANPNPLFISRSV